MKVFQANSKTFVGSLTDEQKFYLLVLLEEDSRASYLRGCLEESAKDWSEEDKRAITNRTREQFYDQIC